jgi:hypothetical protein
MLLYVNHLCFILFNVAVCSVMYCGGVILFLLCWTISALLFIVPVGCCRLSRKRKRTSFPQFLVNLNYKALLTLFIISLLLSFHWVVHWRISAPSHLLQTMLKLPGCTNLSYVSKISVPRISGRDIIDDKMLCIVLSLELHGVKNLLQTFATSDHGQSNTFCLIHW